MQTINDQAYSQLFLEARELPPNLQLVQDSRTRGADPGDEWFRHCGGQRSGMVAWQSPVASVIERVVDIRWVFPTEEMASTYHSQTVQVNSENMPYIQNAPPVGTDCYVFGGRIDFGMAAVTSYIYLFRVRSVVVKFYVAQGEGQSLSIETIASLAQNAFYRLSSFLAAPQMSNPTPLTPAMPFQQGGYQQQQQQQQQQGGYPGYAYPQPPPTRPEYGFSPQQQQIYPQSPQSPIAQWPSQPAGNLPKPSSVLAISYAILGSLAWIIGIPFYILSMMVSAGERLNGGDTDVLIGTGIVSTLLAIPSTIIMLICMYKSWDAVPEQYRSTTPGKAVGFLFIPFFNIYWMFRAIPGLSKSLQRAHRAINPRYRGGAGFALGLIACIMAFIPFLQMGAFIPFLIWLLLANSSKNELLKAYQWRR
jgi:hypothetical protein